VRRVVAITAARNRSAGWWVLSATAALALLIIDGFRPLPMSPVLLACAALLAAIVRMALTFRENLRIRAAGTRDALTDALTGLGNRRRLMENLERGIAHADADHPLLLISLDLDGFKRYNDAFGHLAGDALLARLGQALAESVAEVGEAYRLGGDEFCVLAAPSGPEPETLVASMLAALSEDGGGFSVEASHGTVLVPDEAGTAERALQAADQRLYASKSTRQRTAAAEQTRDALVQALQERAPDLGEHMVGVSGLAHAVGRILELPTEDIDVLVRAAELHDVGKVAVPDSILSKPGPLDEVEWGFMRQHTIVGERILSAAPALVPVARVVRSSHERFDGAGYPDGLAADEIPLGARVVLVCDAYDAMTTDRAYRHGMSHEDAVAELRRCAGEQFDPHVVDAFCEVADRLTAGGPKSRLGAESRVQAI